MEKQYTESLESIFKLEENQIELFLSNLFKEEVKYISVEKIDEFPKANFELLEIIAQAKNSSGDFSNFKIEIYRFNPNLTKGQFQYVIRKFNEIQLYKDLAQKRRIPEITIFITANLIDADKTNLIFLNYTLTGNSGTILNTEGSIMESKLSKSYLIDIPIENDLSISYLLDCLKKEIKE